MQIKKSERQRGGIARWQIQAYQALGYLIGDNPSESANFLRCCGWNILALAGILLFLY